MSYALIVTSVIIGVSARLDALSGNLANFISRLDPHKRGS